MKRRQTPQNLTKHPQNTPSTQIAKEKRTGTLRRNLQSCTPLFAFVFLLFPLTLYNQPVFVRHYYAPGVSGGLASLAAPNGLYFITGQYDPTSTIGQCKTWLAAMDQCGKPMWIYLYHPPNEEAGGFSLAYVEGNRIVVGNYHRLLFMVDAMTGTLLWARQTGTGYFIAGLATDTALNRILVLPARDENDAAVMVYDYNSNLIWSQRYPLPGGSHEEFHSALVLPDTTYVFCGVTSYTGSWDLYVLRTDPQGNVLWARVIGGSFSEGQRVSRTRVDCALSPNSQYIAISSYTTTPAFFVTSSGGNPADVLVVVMDTTGALQWAKTYGEKALDFPKRIRFFHDRRIAVLGETRPYSWIDNDDYRDTSFLLIVDSNGSMLTLRRFLYGSFVYLGIRAETDAVGMDVTPDNGLLLSLYARFPFTGNDALLVKTDSTGYVPCGVDTTYWLQRDITNLISVHIPNIIPIPGPSDASVTVIQTPANLADSFICIACLNLDTPKITFLPRDTICFGDSIQVLFSIDTTTTACFTKRIDATWILNDSVHTDTFSPGMHIAEATIYCASTTITTRDTFWILPPPQITNPDTYACLNDSLFLSLQITSGTPPYSSYQWQPQNLIACDTCPATWIYVPQNTSLVVTVTDQIGCQTSDTIFIEAKPLPSTSTSSNSPVCMGDTLLLSASAQNAQPPYNYTYYTPWGDSLPGPNLTLSPTDTSWSGTWTLIVSDSFGCKDTVLIPIRITPLPILSFSGDTALCFGDTGKLSVTIASGTPPFQINWSGANWFSCNQCDSTRWFSTSSTTFQVFVSDSIGCKDTLSIPITIYPLPIFDLPDTTICYYDSAFRTVPTGIAWQWQPAQWTNCDTCQATWLTPPAQPTTFWVTATSPQGCQWTDTFHIDIDYGEPVQIVHCPSAVLADSQARLYGIAEGINWWWTSPDGTILTSPSHQMIWVRVPSPHGEQDTFILWTESILGCLTADTCILSAVKVQCWDDVWVPNTFTPNGDGKNDVLYVYAINPVRILRWRIYDRWGNLVFAADDFRAGYPLQHSEIGWDGTIHGQPARSDVYVWWLEVQCGRYVVFRKGDVTLIR